MFKILIVIKREIIKAIFNPTFIILTLLFPILYIGLIAFSGYSSKKAVQNIETKFQNVNSILIDDRSGIIKKELAPTNAKFIDNKEQGISSVQNKQSQLFIYFPQDFISSNNIEIFVENNSIGDSNSYQEFTTNLVKSSILSTLDPNSQKLYNSKYNYNVVKYKNGQLDTKTDTIIYLGIIGAVIYFMMLVFGNMWMLTSIAEEKENRMMEIVLTSIKSYEFIIGKIIGNLLIVIIQIILALCVPLLLIVLDLGKYINFSMNLSMFSFSPLSFLTILFYVIVGFLFYSGIMVAVGALSTNQKEASQSSGIFVFLGILPIYASYMIVTDPNGSLAIFFSYFPFTAPMVLLFRNLIGELSSMEFIISTILLLVYLGVSFWFASRMFEVGALEYNRKLGLKGIFRR